MITLDPQVGDLLASCKELREALAGAMRVIASHSAADRCDLTQAFVAEMARIGIRDGVGERADTAMAKARKKVAR